VKKMADGRIWMVQDLMFGDKCSKTTISFVSSDQTGNVTSLTDKTYYGDCTNLKTSSTPSNRGYLYNWAAAINKAGAYYGSSSNVGCSGSASGTAGSAPGACQGICPVGWHVPTATEFNDAFAKFKSAYGCTNASCWLSADTWAGVIGGVCNSSLQFLYPNAAHYWTSAYSSSTTAWNMLANYSYSYTIDEYYNKWSAMTVRCMRNY
jgi:uncharacterized protein (TIGR02145 family)